MIAETNIPHLRNQLELQEAATWESYYTADPTGIAWRYGAGLIRMGSARIIFTSKIDILAYNRVIGLGLDQPVSESDVEEIVSIYRRAGTRRFFVQLTPETGAGELPHLLQSKGFYHYNNWAKIFRPALPVPALPPETDIRPVRKNEARIFADILVEGFQWTKELRYLLGITIGQPGWKHYFALDGEIPIACAAVFIKGEFASLAFAATRQPYRGRGIQSGLISHRIRDAIQAGCNWIVSETAEDKPDRPVTSFRNLQRTGFELAYLKKNFIFEF